MLVIHSNLLLVMYRIFGGGAGGEQQPLLFAEERRRKEKLAAAAAAATEMENVKRLVNQIAYTPAPNLSKLSPLHRSLIPLLSVASSLYKLALFFRHHLYLLGLFHKRRLPVPVISIGNLTWGGNGKTPMVEFLALWFSKAGISPLILTRGYAGGDEAKMLQRHLLNTSAKIGVGANRATTAARFFERYGYMDHFGSSNFERLCSHKNVGLNSKEDKIGVVILDDGMQHWSLSRDLEIVMINGLMPWGNNYLIPLGPLREPLTALKRADLAVVHHADLVSDRDLQDIEYTIREVNEALPIFFTSLAPLYFFEVKNSYAKLSLKVLHGVVVLCVSAIGSANAFIQVIEKVGPSYVAQMNFSDHHSFHRKDIEMIREKLRELYRDFGVKPNVVVTEKDYDRDPIILKDLDPFEVLVLCSQLQVLPTARHTQESFKNLLMQLMEVKVSTRGK